MKKKTKIIFCSVIFFIVFIVFFLPAGGTSNDSKYYFRKLVISPIPKSLTEYKTHGLFNPTLGDGYFEVSFTIKPDDFELILNSKKWEKSDYISSTYSDNFKKIFKESEDNIELYHYKMENQPSSYGELWMITNKKHTKVIINGQI